MSTLSEKLTAILEDREMTVAQVARMCAIDRPTVYQYFTGKRTISNPEHLKMISSTLCLTPQEELEVNDAYAIEKVGQSLYAQRKKAQELLRYIPTPTPNLWTPTAESDFTIPQGPILHDEADVFQAMFCILRQSFEEGAPLWIMLQPEHRNLLSAFRFFTGYPSQSEITHIICLESDSKQGRIENLDRVKDILAISTMVHRYRPIYYYGRASERFGPMNVLPGTIIGSKAVLQISATGRLGLIHTHPQVVESFRTRYQEVSRQCKPLLSYKEHIESELFWGVASLAAGDCRQDLEMPSSLCTSAFWTEALLRRYLSPNIPNWEETVQQYCRNARGLLKVRQGSHVTQILNPHNVRDFMKTGILREYPPEFVTGALSVPDRRYLVEQVLSACKAGWLQLRMLPENTPFVNQRAEVCLWNQFNLAIQVWLEGRIMLFTILEPGIINAVRDYLESLLEEPATLPQHETIALLQHWMKELL